MQDYAKAIYALQRQGGDQVTNNALAERLGVSPASASGMVKKLDSLGLVTHEPYRGVRLTAAGERIALEVVRHHRLLELYLSETLGLSWDQVHAEAEVLEHVLSDELAEVIAQKLGDPSHDPHGEPIPTRDGHLGADATVSLESVSTGAHGTFKGIYDAQPAMLRYLSERGVTPGLAFEVVDRQPFGGPLFVRLGSEVHALGGDLARAMRVEVG